MLLTHGSDLSPASGVTRVSAICLHIPQGVSAGSWGAAPRQPSAGAWDKEQSWAGRMLYCFMAVGRGEHMDMTYCFVPGQS